MKTPISSPTVSTSNGRRGGKNLSVHFQTISPATSSDREDPPIQNRENDLQEFLQMKPSSQNQLQTTIQVIEKEQCEDIGGETPMIVEEMKTKAQAQVMKKAVKRKKPTTSKKTAAAAKKNPRELPDPEADSFLGVLELIWTTEVYQTILEKLKYGEQKSMIEKNLSLKREFTSLISLWKTILKLIVHRMRAKQCAGLSWNVFRTILCDSELLYTTCLQFKMSDTAIKIFHEYVSKEETPVVASKGPSSSSQIMQTTTSMSSTIAPIMEIPVDVNESKKSEENADNLDLIEDFFGLQNVPASTGSISQSISRQANGKQYILKSPGECGLNVVKLEIYII